MTMKELRGIVADLVAKTHGNQEFIRQIRDGEQDDGPWMQGGIAVMDYINEQWMLLPIQDTEAHDG
jgi:hypothetical protein